MKKTGNDNINTKLYWDHIYTSKKDQEALEKVSHFTEDWVIDENIGRPVGPSKRFVTAVNQIEEGNRVLDIGCGFGIFTGAVIDKFPFNEVWGIDISSKAIEDNKKKHPGVIYYQQYIGNLNKVPENYFDVVFSGEVLEHLEDPNTLFIDAFNSLKSGGKFVLTTPREEAIDSPEHVWFFKEDDIKSMYESNGFTNVEFISLPGMEKRMVIFAVGKKK